MNTARTTGRLAGLDILTAGRKTQTIRSRLKHWRTLKSFALVYICEGSGSFESNETAEVQVQAGDCFFLFPGVSHFYGPPDNSIWKEIFVVFHGGIADHMLKVNTLNPSKPVIAVPAVRRSEFQSNLESLAEQYRSKSGEYRLRCTSLLYNSLLLAALPQESQPPRAAEALLLDDMKQILHRHIASSREIPSYFHTSRYSYNTLRMEFSRLTGQSPGQYLNDLRMQHAEEQLLWSSLNITEIGRGLGYSDSRYFSRAFRKHAGCSPREYRQRYYLIR